MHFRRLILAPLTFATALMATSALAQQQQTVYEWKDAKGVTHYTDMPPKGAHKVRAVTNRASAPVAVKAAQESNSPQCLDARSNLLRLKGGQAIGVDTDNDGKADRNLTDQERTDQTALNEAAVKAYCKTP